MERIFFSLDPIAFSRSPIPTLLQSVSSVSGSYLITGELETLQQADAIGYSDTAAEKTVTRTHPSGAALNSILPIVKVPVVSTDVNLGGPPQPSSSNPWTMHMTPPLHVVGPVLFPSSACYFYRS